MLDSILIVVLFLASLANALVGSIVLLRNNKRQLNRMFFALSLSIAGWTASNALFQLAASQSSKFTVALISYGFAAVLGVYFYSFCVTLTKDYLPEKTAVSRGLMVAGAIAGLLSLIPGIVGLRVEANGEIITNNAGLALYGLVLISLLARSIYLLFASRKYSPVRERNLTNTIIISFTAALLIGLFFNLILPLIHIYDYVVIGPIGSLVLVGGTAYTIIRHKLFDIKLIIARSIAYVASLGAFAAVYGFVVFGLAQIFFDFKFPITVQILLSVATGVAALSFHYFKSAFDKTTNRLFYQDAYSAEELFDEYNKALVSTIDLDLLLKRTSEVMARHVKVGYCLVGIGEGVNEQYRVIGTRTKRYARKRISASDMALISHQYPSIVTDDLPQSAAALHSTLQEYDVALLIRLAPNNRAKHSSVGYMALGPKLSGNPYTAQDIKVVETLANELIVAIQNALRFEEIEKFNETLQQKVTEATRQLRESNKKLKQLNDSKDDFIGMASHQLRTPLTAIKGYVSLVMDGDAGKVTVTQKKLLQQAFSSSQKMVYLVADLLNVSRLKTGKFIIERTPTNLVKLINDEMAQLKTEAATRNVELQFDMPADFPALPFDETKTRQVIMNFLDNAIYYTPAGGHVKAELKELPNSVEFRVIDNGIGVPKADQYHMFSKFYRAKNAQRTRPDGTGLGLYMAQKVIIAQGGAILFSSEEGKGSTFGFSFPKNMPTGSVVVPAQTRD